MRIRQEGRSWCLRVYRKRERDARQPLSSGGYEWSGALDGEYLDRTGLQSGQSLTSHSLKSVSTERMQGQVMNRSIAVQIGVYTSYMI